MAIQTGRTVGKYARVMVHDSSATFREIPVTAINGVGLNYPEVDVSAIQDAVLGMLNGQPDYTLELSGPWDTTAATTATTASATASSLSGSHTVLYNLANHLTPLGFAIYLGVRHYWTTGEPIFGISATTGVAGNGILCMNYNVDPVASTYTATFRMSPGSAAPAWGVAVLT
jgi:hypothetical protein